MPSARRAKKGQTGRGKSSEAPAGQTWDQQSGPDEHDGRANTQAGDKGREPGGRWSKPYYDTPAVIVGRNIVKEP